MHDDEWIGAELNCINAPPPPEAAFCPAVTKLKHGKDVLPANEVRGGSLKTKIGD